MASRRRGSASLSRSFPPTFGGSSGWSGGTRKTTIASSIPTGTTATCAWRVPGAARSNRPAPPLRRGYMAIDTTQIAVPPREAIPVPQTSAPRRLSGWDHIGFSVPDLVEPERWYIDVLGAELVARRGWGGETA